MAKDLREKVGKQYKGTRRTRQAVHGECSVELAKWTFPVIVSFSRDPCEYESLTHGSNGRDGQTYHEATRPVPTQWKRAARQRALILPTGKRTLTYLACDVSLSSLQCVGKAGTHASFNGWERMGLQVNLMLPWRKTGE